MDFKLQRSGAWARPRGLLMSDERTPRIIAPRFEGIAINTPEDVFFEGDGLLEGCDVSFPLAGACRFASGTLGHANSFVEAIWIVAIDLETYRPYGWMFHHGGDPVPRDLIDPPASGLSIGQVFNVDLATALELPARPTRYAVHASLGPFRSNVLVTRVQRAARA